MNDLFKQDAVTLPDPNSNSQSTDEQTKFCKQCQRNLPSALFIDEHGRQKKTCDPCRSYQRRYYVEVAGGYQHQKAKRRKIFGKPRLAGQKICRRCMTAKPLTDFVLADGKNSTCCPPCREYSSAWMAGRRANLSPEQLSEVRRKSRLRVHKYRQAVLDHYGCFCECCGEWREQFLAIDHINGGGGKERREIGAGTQFYSWLIKRGFPSGYRTLCTNCNFAMRFGHRCPHEAEREQFQFLDRPIPGFEFLGGTRMTVQ